MLNIIYRRSKALRDVMVRLRMYRWHESHECQAKLETPFCHAVRWFHLYLSDIQRICTIVWVTTHSADFTMLIRWITHLSPPSDLKQESLTLKKKVKTQRSYVRLCNVVTQELYPRFHSIKPTFYVSNQFWTLSFVFLNTVFNEQ